MVRIVETCCKMHNMDGADDERPNIVSCFMCCQTNTLSKQSREPTQYLPMIILRIATTVVEKYRVAFWRRSPQRLSSVTTSNRTHRPIFP